MNLNILLLLLVATIACGSALDGSNGNPLRQPRTFFSRGQVSHSDKDDEKYEHDKHNSKHMLTVVKYSSSARGTRFRRNADLMDVDVAQIEAPAPAPVPASDMEASSTFWPFTWLNPHRRRYGRPYGTYRRKGWWPSGSAVRNQWW